MEQESAYLAPLANAATYSIHGPQDRVRPLPDEQVVVAGDDATRLVLEEYVRQSVT